MSHARHIAKSIVRALRKEGFTAYFAGGCVRDELLGLDPADYDVATDARPDDVRRLFPGANEVGAAFGVMLVRRGGVTVEVTTFRREGPYSDRRRPDEVHYADAESDARRRDFTINALFLDPLAPPERREDPEARRAEPPFPVEGKVIDYVGGLDDLRGRVIRAVGDPDVRFAEDHLRALRAVRFAARLDFTIDRQTVEAIHRHARELAGVSRERIGEEMRMMLTPPTRAAAIRLIEMHGLDGPALNEPCLGTPPEKTLTTDRLPAEADFSTALAAWTLDRADRRGETDAGESSPEDLARQWRSALCLSNAESDSLRAILHGVAELADKFLTLGVAEQKRLASAPWRPQAVAILCARDPSAAEKIDRRIEELASDGIGLAPTPLLSGDDLLSIGLRPSPRIGRLLREVYDAQLEGRVADQAQAMNLVRTRLADDQSRDAAANTTDPPDE